MRQYVVTVFDEWVYETAMYTSDAYEDLLGSSDRLALQAIADAVSGENVTLTVRLESSIDGIHWTNHGDLINGVAIDIGQTNTAFGFTGAALAPLMQRVRIRVSLGGTTPQARVRVIACGRDQARHRRAAAMGALPDGAAARPPMTPAAAAPMGGGAAGAAGSPPLARPLAMPPADAGARVTKRPLVRPG